MAHQTRLHADTAVAHLALKLRFGRQGRNRVDNDHVYRPGPHKRVRNLKRLLARIGLRDQQLVNVYAKFFSILRVKRMLRINKGTDATGFLLFCNAVQCQRGLTGRLWPINFDDTPHWQAANAKRDIKAKRASRARPNILDCPFGAQLHDRPFAELTFDLGQRAVERLLLFCGFLAVHCQKICRCH